MCLFISKEQEIEKAMYPIATNTPIISGDGQTIFKGIIKQFETNNMAKN